MRGVRRSPLTSTGGGALDASTRAAPPQPSDAGAADATPAAPNVRNAAVTAAAMDFFMWVLPLLGCADTGRCPQWLRAESIAGGGSAAA